MAEESLIEAEAAGVLLRAGLPMAAVDCMIAFAKAKGTELRYKRLLLEARDMFARGDFDANDKQRERLRSWCADIDAIKERDGVAHGPTTQRPGVGAMWRVPARP